MDPLLTRRSIRAYTDAPVSNEELRYLLEAAMCAPSAGNQRPWHFVVLRDRATLQAIPRFHPYASMLPGAALAIAVCGDTTREKHKGCWVLDCSAATQNLLLAAETRGLGAVWLGLYPVADRMEGMRGLLNLPEGVEPFALVALGHPAETKPAIDRFDSERVHLEKW